MKPFIVTLLLILLYSCGPDYSEQEEQITSGLSAMNSDAYTMAKCIFIIPENTCGVCVGGSFSFLKQNIHNEAIYAIVSSYPSTKDLKLKYGNDIISNERVLLDVNEDLAGSGMRRGSPTVVLLNEGKIINMLDISPNTMNDVFNQTLNHLTD